MVFKPLTLVVPQSITRQFVAQAKEAYPRETLAYLIGTQGEGLSMTAECLWVPPDLESRCKEDGINIQGSWFRGARRFAKRSHMVVLGDIHSHPYPYSDRLIVDCAPSEVDWDRARPGLIQGICRIKQRPDKRLTARVRYWGPILPVNT